MPRALSQAARQAIFASDTPEVFCVLLVLGDGQLDPEIRVCSGGRDLTHLGETFLYAPFRLALPDDNDSQPEVTLQLDNVDRSIITAVADLDAPLSIKLLVVLASSPDVVEAGPFFLTLREFTADAQVLEGALRFEDLLNEPYPGDTITPATFPGVPY